MPSTSLRWMPRSATRDDRGTQARAPSRPPGRPGNVGDARPPQAGSPGHRARQRSHGWLLWSTLREGLHSSDTAMMIRLSSLEQSSPRRCHVRRNPVRDVVMFGGIQSETLSCLEQSSQRLQPRRIKECSLGARFPSQGFMSDRHGPRPRGECTPAAHPPQCLMKRPLLRHLKEAIRLAVRLLTVS
jgi:hypothetical protein